MKLGSAQVSVLTEAASEVCTACPWVWIESYERRQVESLTARGLLGSTRKLFGITPKGCLVMRRYDRDLAQRAIAGLRREASTPGSVMPWDV